MLIDFFLPKVIQFPQVMQFSNSGEHYIMPHTQALKFLADHSLTSSILCFSWSTIRDDLEKLFKYV